MESLSKGLETVGSGQLKSLSNHWLAIKIKNKTRTSTPTTAIQDCTVVSSQGN